MKKKHLILPYLLKSHIFFPKFVDTIGFYTSILFIWSKTTINYKGSEVDDDMLGSMILNLELNENEAHKY